MFSYTSRIWSSRPTDHTRTRCSCPASSWQTVRATLSVGRFISGAFFAPLHLQVLGLFALSVCLSVCLQALLTARGHTRLQSSGRSCSVGKRHFLRHLYIKCIVLPRQARDKHRENSKQERRFRRWLQRLPQLDRRRRCGRGWQRPCPCGLGREAGAPRCDYRACEHRG